MGIALLLDGFPQPEAVSKIFYPDNITVSAMRIRFGVSSWGNPLDIAEAEAVAFILPFQCFSDFQVQSLSSNGGYPNS